MNKQWNIEEIHFIKIWSQLLLKKTGKYHEIFCVKQKKIQIVEKEKVF